MDTTATKERYFPYGIQLTREWWDRLELSGVRAELRAKADVPEVVFVRHLAARLNRLPDREGPPVQARILNLYALLTRVYRHVVDRYAGKQVPDALANAARSAGLDFAEGDLAGALKAFVFEFPPEPVLDGQEDAGAFLAETSPDRRRRLALAEGLLLRVAGENPAIDDFREVLEADALEAESAFPGVMKAIEDALRDAPPVEPFGLSLPDLLREPIRRHPNSLMDQLEFIRSSWGSLLPPDVFAGILRAFDLVREEEREWWDGGAGPSQVLEFTPGSPAGYGGARYDYAEPEAFSPDWDWMSNVVLIAKMTYVWLDQLTKKYGRPITRLDEIPDEELDRLARWGFTGLWLIGVWERSPASRKIKQICGNPEAISSAYSLFDYQVAADLGGDAGIANLRERCLRRGIRLASDMVPNHCGLFSKWVLEHPDWFIQSPVPPYPVYSFTGPDLSDDPNVGLFIEDGYWSKRDAAVVFKREDRRTGEVRYIYHGNDGTSTPWNDTAQLDYLKPELREAVIRTILHVAHNFPIIRFDAAMTLSKFHYARLWYPQPGQGGGVPSRSDHAMTRDQFDAAFPVEFWREVVDRVAAEAPGTLLLAEAFWLMEGYFVRTLGMHRVYNSAFMNMLKMEENAKYRQTIRNVAEFNPEILKRFVNFMNNPDERTAVEQFGKEGKYIGAAVLLVTMPGLPMFGHGQIEGYHEKYGMEYKKAYWDEPVDENLVAEHERRVFPLMRKRYLFSGSQDFALYDFFAGTGVDENVFAYSNRAGNERGLIVYHNRWADVGGWIRTSAGFGVKGPDGQMVVQQTTLGEALAIDGSDGVFYCFRDWATGLEYIRGGRELREQGLFVELGGYQYMAFLDWREVHDDADRTWSRLAWRLGGRPVPSLEEERKRERFGAVHEAVRVVANRAAAGEDPDGTAAETATLDFVRALLRGLNVDADPAPARLKRGAGAGATATTSTTTTTTTSTTAGATEPATEQATEKAIRTRLPRTARDRAILALLGALDRASASLREGAAGPTAAWIRDTALWTILRETLDAIPPSADGDDLGAPAALLEALLGNASFATSFAAHPDDALARLASAPAVQRAIGAHEADGVTWFSKELFERLAEWLEFVAERDGKAPADDPGADAEAAEPLAAALARRAEKAGYRLDALIGA